MSIPEQILDHRARFERLQYEAAERRDRALTDQRSPEFTAEKRVQIWERLHQVRLPRSPAHAVLPHVARQTGLGLEEVLEVQRQRTLASDPAG